LVRHSYFVGEEHFLELAEVNAVTVVFVVVSEEGGEDVLLVDLLHVEQRADELAVLDAAGAALVHVALDFEHFRFRDILPDAPDQQFEFSQLELATFVRVLLLEHLLDFVALHVHGAQPLDEFADGLVHAARLLDLSQSVGQAQRVRLHQLLDLLLVFLVDILEERGVQQFSGHAPLHGVLLQHAGEQLFGLVTVCVERTAEFEFVTHYLVANHFVVLGVSLGFELGDLACNHFLQQTATRIHVLGEILGAHALEHLRRHLNVCSL